MVRAPFFERGSSMKRSKHSLSHYRLTSLNQGELYPVMCEEILPGDSWRQQSAALVRVSPLVAPVMHPVEVSIHSWFVPSRICWDNWENFITGSNTALVVPLLTIDPGLDPGNDNCHRLAQAFGIGVNTATYTVNALPFRAYNRIYNEFYRDQDLSALTSQSTGDGPDTANAYSIRRVSWEKDYFTTARANPQQGASTEVVQLQVTGTLPVTGIGKGNATFPTNNQAVRETGGGTPTYATSAAIDASNVNTQFWVQQDGATGFPNIRAQGGGLGVSMDINAWRQSMAMQRIREHRNRFGHRYRDMLAFLGVNSSDARLQRPEYLGGGKQTISFSEVLVTADVGGTSPGDMVGHGIAAVRTRPFKRFFEEHGYIFTMMYVRPKTVYMNRVPRTFLRRDYEQFWQKELEMLGEQVITNFEVYGDAGAPAGTFGYIPRYDEYRHGESSVSGEFRTLLNYWNMARDFTAQPVLNQAFVECVPTDRIYGSTTTDELYVMMSHRIAARRLVSKRARS